MQKNRNAMDGAFKLEFTLEGLPPTLNRLNSMHLMAKWRLNRKWREAVECAVAGRIPKVPLDKARITIIRHSSVEGDGDNYSGGYKGIVDSLRYLKILSNDRVSNIGNVKTLWNKEKPGKVFITIRIESLLTN